MTLPKKTIKAFCARCRKDFTRAIFLSMDFYFLSLDHSLWNIFMFSKSNSSESWWSMPNIFFNTKGFKRTLHWVAYCEIKPWPFSPFYPSEERNSLKGLYKFYLWMFHFAVRQRFAQFGIGTVYINCPGTTWTIFPNLIFWSFILFLTTGITKQYYNYANKVYLTAVQS